MIIEGMAQQGAEPTYCMGDDIPLSVLSDKPHMLYDYFKQRFAQVCACHQLLMCAAVHWPCPGPCDQMELCIGLVLDLVANWSCAAVTDCCPACTHSVGSSDQNMLCPC